MQNVPLQSPGDDLNSTYTVREYLVGSDHILFGTLFDFMFRKGMITVWKPVSFYPKIALIFLIVMIWTGPVFLFGANRYYGTTTRDWEEILNRLPEFPVHREQKRDAESPEQIVIDEQTGEIIQGDMLLFGDTRVDFNNLHIDINQPNPAMYTSSTTSPASHIQPVTIGQVVTVLITLSMKPSEIIEILKSLIREGVLQAELVVR